MSNETKPTEVSALREDTLESNVRLAVEGGEDVEETVRQATYDALSEKPLDLESLRRIITSVVEGARHGAQRELQQTAEQAQLARSRFEQAIDGLDTALAQFAEAAKLTLEEAVGRAQTFGSEDLAKVRSDLESLESLFLETLKTTATATQGFVADTLRGILEHSERQGTAVGAQLQETLASFGQHVAGTGFSGIGTGVQLAHATADLMRDIAAGVLAGLADRLQPRRYDKDRPD
ncbi:DUF6781 family protein [Methylococcus sp. EFPC2]|uniref:DUF6781 family protein n=1 Tax=Methylococcus sp. EFPC2 TaxID=2812648 RepID=UPI0019678859|nr:DUF6781 family protein [Methylococcus sp. EFPC2]QSA97713.1 hypothetical protein JWZ97_02430 [Methylococcus sp. EFPC2]